MLRRKGNSRGNRERKQRCRSAERQDTAIRSGADNGAVFSRTGLLREFAVFGLLDLFISFLFFRSWIAFIALLPMFVPYLKERRRDITLERSSRIRGEFLTAVQLLSSSLQAGYSAENAAREALKELKKIYPQDAFITREFQELCTKMALNVPIEKLFTQMAQRSGIDDMISFAQVFAAARRSGGDLIAISRNTVSVIRLKEETRASLQTSLSGKQMEQNMISLIPLLILAYVGLTTGDLLAPMYSTLPGRIVMCASLAVYGCAFLWGKRIMDIQV